MFRLVKILIIFILHISGITQAASLKDLFSNKIDHFTIEDGLPENSVRCIEKDDYGNYWICTKGGLVRYDGYDFETIIEDRFGNDLSMKIRDIEILKNIIYVATEIGLYKLNIETRTIEKVKIFQAQNLFVYKVHIHKDSIYLGTKDGLIKIDDEEISFYFTGHTIRDFLIENEFITLASIGRGLFNTNITNLNNAQDARFKYLKNIHVLDIKKINDKYYLSTYGSGLHILDDNLQPILILNSCDLDNCLPSDYVKSVSLLAGEIILSTRAGLVAIDSQGKVIYKVSLADYIKNDYITDSTEFFKVSDEFIWIGLRPGGIIRIDKRNRGVSVLSNNADVNTAADRGIFAITMHNNRIYAGTYDGLYIANNQAKSLKRITAVPATKRINALCSFQNREIIISTSTGVLSYDTSNETLKSMSDEISEQTSLTNICLEDHILFSLNTRIIANWPKLDKSQTIELGSTIRAVTHHHDLLYVSTDESIHIFEHINKTYILISELSTKEVVFNFTANDEKLYGLSSQSIFEINKDQINRDVYPIPKELKGIIIYSGSVMNDEVWLASNMGVIKLFEDARFNQFTQIHGFGDREYNQSANYYDKSTNNLYFGGLRNLTKIHIEKFTKSLELRENIISKVRLISADSNVIKESYVIPESLSISEGDTLEIGLGLIDSHLRYSSEFYYNIESKFSQSKISLEPKQEFIRIVNVGYNDFDLKFPFSEEVIDVQVIPHIWKRWWAYAIYFTIFITICYFISKHFQRIQASKHNEEFIKKQLDSKRQQLASLSHELRTPLNSIIGILSSKDIDNEKRGYLQSSSFLLRSLIDNVLNNASTEVGNKLVVEKDEIDLREQITAAKNILNPYLESANIRVNIVIHDSTPSRIGCDGTKLQQVIINLIKNSIKHSKTANQIIIEVSEKNGQIYIAISDNGEGVPKNSHEKIFEVFHKGKDNSSGFGLGLHISKKICCHMGGDLVIDSKYKLGARFIMSFAFDEISTNRDSNDEIFVPTKGRPKKLLILEDDPLNSYAIKLLLNKISHDDYLMCATLNEFNKAFSDVYEVIILDLNFGADINGVDLAELLRQRNYSGEIYIHSAETASEVIEASESFVTSYLIKPVKIRDLETISFYWS